MCYVWARHDWYEFYLDLTMWVKWQSMLNHENNHLNIAFRGQLCTSSLLPGILWSLFTFYRFNPVIFLSWWITSKPIFVEGYCGSYSLLTKYPILTNSWSAYEQDNIKTVTPIMSFWGILSGLGGSALIKK